MHYWEKSGFFGGHLFLDFINTYDDLGKTRDENALPDWESVQRWSNSVGLINVKELRALKKLTDTAFVEKELQALYQLRELGWNIFNRIAAMKSPKATDLASVDAAIKWSCQFATMKKEKRCYRWTARASLLDPTLIRVKLGLALFNLLSTEDLDRLNECQSCTGLFLNHGRGIGRRWCRMKTCGNRAKTNRFRGV